MLVVEDLSAPADGEPTRRWIHAGERLRALDPARFARVLAIAEGFVSIYERPDESEHAFEARLRRALGGGAS